MAFSGYLDASAAGCLNDDDTILGPDLMFGVLRRLPDFPGQICSGFREVFIDEHSVSECCVLELFSSSVDSLTNAIVRELDDDVSPLSRRR